MFAMKSTAAYNSNLQLEVGGSSLGRNGGQDKIRISPGEAFPGSVFDASGLQAALTSGIIVRFAYTTERRAIATAWNTAGTQVFTYTMPTNPWVFTGIYPLNVYLDYTSMTYLKPWLVDTTGTAGYAKFVAKVGA